VPATAPLCFVVGSIVKKTPVADYVSDFMSSSDGLALANAFTTIKDSRLHRRAVDLVEEIAGDPR
jgi:hypothetical protein